MSHDHQQGLACSNLTNVSFPKVPSDRNESKCELSSDNKLTSEEVDHLCSVLERAKKFEEEEAMQTKLFEGQLYKYTNVVKGWQYRWFVINHNKGTLEYYMIDDKKRSYPRGCVHLLGCQINPSDEDSQTFTVNSAFGEMFKLKAIDAKFRQIWVDELRSAALKQEAKNQEINSTLPNSNCSFITSPLTSNLHQSFESLREQMLVTEKCHTAVVNSIEDISNTDEDLLLIKAVSNATILSLEQCFSILEKMSH